MATDSHRRRQALIKRLARLKGEPAPSVVIAAMVGPGAEPCAACAAEMLGCTDLDLSVLLAMYPTAAAFRQFVEQFGPDDQLLGHGLAAVSALLNWHREATVATEHLSYLLPSVILLDEAYREAILRIEALSEEQYLDDDAEEDDGEDEQGEGEDVVDYHDIPRHKLGQALQVPRCMAKGARVLLAIDDNNAFSRALAMLADITPESVHTGVKQLRETSSLFFEAAKDIGQNFPDFLRDETAASDVAGPAELMAQQVEQMAERLDEYRDRLDPIAIMSSYLEFAIEFDLIAASDTINAYLEEARGQLG